MNKQYNFERDVKFLTGRGALRNATIIMSNMGCRKVLLIATHSQLSESELVNCGIYPTTVRLSIGTEHIDDIIEDLNQAFEKSAL